MLTLTLHKHTQTRTNVLIVNLRPAKGCDKRESGLWANDEQTHTWPWKTQKKIQTGTMEVRMFGINTDMHAMRELRSEGAEQVITSDDSHQKYKASSLKAHVFSFTPQTRAKHFSNDAWAELLMQGYDMRARGSCICTAIAYKICGILLTLCTSHTQKSSSFPPKIMPCTEVSHLVRSMKREGDGNKQVLSLSSPGAEA